ncbi:MAG: Kae1-associated kinase Bud32 [Thermoprotei archaeon]|nr:MAG: Kae1-associated kinase Bud32 [Thermoprotei archaeon]
MSHGITTTGISGELISIGAEAILVKINWYGLPAIKKIRVSKAYRHPVLDRHLRVKRTISEAKLLTEAHRIGVAVPTLYDVDLKECTLTMEYIDGIKARDIVNSMDRRDLKDLFNKLGYYVGLLHKVGIIHGDLTTSNVLITERGPFLIDFGLGAFSNYLEDRGVDVHLLLRVLESTHYKVAKEAFEYFVEGYREAFPSIVEDLLSKIRDIRMRGRYIIRKRVQY